MNVNHLQRNLAGAILLGLLTCTGCTSKPRLDGRSPQTLKDSIQAISKNLTVEERADFQRGIQSIKSSIEKRGVTLIGGDQAVERKLCNELDGQTAADVIARGQEARQRQRKKVKEMFPRVDIP